MTTHVQALIVWFCFLFSVVPQVANGITLLRALVLKWDYFPSLTELDEEVQVRRAGDRYSLSFTLLLDDNSPQVFILGVLFIFLGFTNFYYTITIVQEKRRRAEHRRQSMSVSKSSGPKEAAGKQSGAAGAKGGSGKKEE